MARNTKNQEIEVPEITEYGNITITDQPVMKKSGGTNDFRNLDRKN